MALLLAHQRQKRSRNDIHQNERRGRRTLHAKNINQFDDCSDDEVDFEIPSHQQQQRSPPPRTQQLLQNYSLKCLTSTSVIGISSNAKNGEEMDIQNGNQSELEKKEEANTKAARDTVEEDSTNTNAPSFPATPNAVEQEIKENEKTKEEDLYDMEGQKQRNYQLMVRGLQERRLGDNSISDDENNNIDDDDDDESCSSTSTTCSSGGNQRRRMAFPTTDRTNSIAIDSNNNNNTNTDPMDRSMDIQSLLKNAAKATDWGTWLEKKDNTIKNDTSTEKEIMMEETTNGKEEDKDDNDEDSSTGSATEEEEDAGENYSTGDAGVTTRSRSSSSSSCCSSGGIGGTPDSGVEESVKSPTIGSRIAVYWTDVDEFYEGEVTRKRKKSKTKLRKKSPPKGNQNNKDFLHEYYIEYDDGDTEWLDLTRHEFKLLPAGLKYRPQTATATCSASNDLNEEMETEKDKENDDENNDGDEPNNPQQQQQAVTTLTTKKGQKRKRRPMVKWDERFLELVEYKERYGHDAEPTSGGSTPTQYRPLAVWLSAQRSFWRRQFQQQHPNEQQEVGGGKKQICSKEHARLLRALGCLGFLDDKDDGDDHENDDMADAHGQQDGSDQQIEAPPPRNPPFASAAAEAGNELDQEQEPKKKRQRILRSKKVSWSVRFEQVKEFQKRVGHLKPRRTRAPSTSASTSTPTKQTNNDDVDDTLYHWLANQRSHYRNGVFLSLHQIQLHRQIGTPGFEEHLGHERFRTDSAAAATAKENNAERGVEDDDDNANDDPPTSSKLHLPSTSTKIVSLLPAVPPTNLPQSQSIFPSESTATNGNNNNNNKRPDTADQDNSMVSGKKQKSHNHQEGLDGSFESSKGSPDLNDPAQQQQPQQGRPKDAPTQAQSVRTSRLQTGICDPSHQKPPPQQRDPWETRFAELVAFKTTFRHVNVDSSNSHKSLAGWLALQRTDFRMGNTTDLPESRISLLRDLGCRGFLNSQKRVSGWKLKIQQLKDFRDKFGHVNPQATAATVAAQASPSLSSRQINERELGIWLNTERRNYRLGHTLPGQLQALRDLGCQGFKEEDDDNNSKSALPLAMKPSKETAPIAGPPPPTTTTTAAASAAASAAAAAAAAADPASPLSGSSEATMTKKKSRIPAQLSTRCPTSPPPATWDERLEELKAYKIQHGGDEPKFKGVLDVHFGLAQWLSVQKIMYKNGNITPERKRKLLSIQCNLGSELKDQKQEAGGQEQAKNASAHSSTPSQPPKNHHEASCETILIQSDEPSNNLTKAPKQSSQGKRNKPISWESRFANLQAYKARHGHANPTRSKLGPEAAHKLGRWLNDQRRYFRSGTLRSDKLQKLLGLGCTGFEIEKSSADSRELNGKDEGDSEEQERDEGSESDVDNRPDPAPPKQDCVLATTTRSGRNPTSKRRFGIEDYNFY